MMGEIQHLDDNWYMLFLYVFLHLWVDFVPITEEANRTWDSLFFFPSLFLSCSRCGETA
jgi:hypothetical protein